jgi:hypothetical protein
MLPGTTHPKPYQRIWAAAYTDSKVECFEVRTVDQKQITPYYPYWHKEFPLGTALVDFLDADLTAWDGHLQQIQNHVDAINAHQNASGHFEELFDFTRFWLRKSALFAPLAASLERLQLVYERGERLSLEELERQVAYYKELQPRLRYLVQNFFTAEADGSQTEKERYVSCWQKDKVHYWELHFGQIQMQEVWVGGEQSCPYDNVLELMYQPTQEAAPQEFVTRDVVCSEEPSDVVDYVLNRYLDANLEFRVCKYCGRYFGARRGSKGDYCERMIEGSTKTCKQAGSVRLYEKRKFEIPAVKEYKRSYKAHNARIRYGIMTKEEFAVWSAEAREKRDLCLAGKLSLEEFVAWLDSDKM